jgi:acylphosphatase
MSTTGSELASLHVIVKGRVQGVFFRDFTKRHASALGLTGYVRNLRDKKSIEVIAEGKLERLKELLNFLYQGPAAAQVEKLDISWSSYSGHFVDFKIRLSAD